MPGENNMQIMLITMHAYAHSDSPLLHFVHTSAGLKCFHALILWTMLLVWGHPGTDFSSRWHMDWIQPVRVHWNFSPRALELLKSCLVLLPTITSYPPHVAIPVFSAAPHDYPSHEASKICCGVVSGHFLWWPPSWGTILVFSMVCEPAWCSG